MKRRKAKTRNVSTGYDPEPLRVLHVSTPLSWRGGEQQLAHLFKALEEEGVQQSILCAKGSALEKYCLENGWPFASFRSKGLLGLGVSWVLRGLVRSYGPDLVHVHDAHAHTAAYMATVLFRARVRSLFIVGWISRSEKMRFPGGSSIIHR